MSMQDYDIAENLLRQQPHVSSFAGPQPESRVRAAERRLGCVFPPTYRRFICEHGAGDVGSESFYGVSQDNLDSVGGSNIVWFTLRKRQTTHLQPDRQFPLELIPVYNLGNGELFCLDLSNVQDQEAPVVVYSPGGPTNQQRDLIACDFGEFYRQIVENQILGKPLQWGNARE